MCKPRKIFGQKTTKNKKTIDKQRVLYYNVIGKRRLIFVFAKNIADKIVRAGENHGGFLR